MTRACTPRARRRSNVVPFPPQHAVKALLIYDEMRGIPKGRPVDILKLHGLAESMLRARFARRAYPANVVAIADARAAAASTAPASMTPAAESMEARLQRIADWWATASDAEVNALLARRGVLNIGSADGELPDPAA